VPLPADPDEILAAVGLADRPKARTSQLSGGQRRRLDVALGILGRPEMLFLDEPTTGFDPEVRRQFWSLIAGLRDNGTTILLTTHYLDEAEFLADRVAVIAEGRIRDVSAPATLGGRHHAPATVRWADADGRHEEVTGEPGRVVADLVARHGGEPSELTVTRPSLEDTYLHMIGEAR
jgi:ABC-2 type transport system ATP-binding protein